MIRTTMRDEEDLGRFGTKAVHSGTNPVGGGVNTPVFLILDVPSN